MKRHFPLLNPGPGLPSRALCVTWFSPGTLFLFWMCLHTLSSGCLGSCCMLLLGHCSLLSPHWQIVASWPSLDFTCFNMPALSSLVETTVTPTSTTSGCCVPTVFTCLILRAFSQGSRTYSGEPARQPALVSISVTYRLYYPGQVALPLCALVASSAKGDSSVHFRGSGEDEII